MTPTAKSSATRINLYLDIILALGFLITMEEKLTGPALHEWLGIALGASLVIHLLLHWDWIVAVTGRFFQTMPRSSRINYLLNTALFAAFTLIIFSGLMISEAVAGTFGLAGPTDPFWKMLHTMASDAVLLLVGLHLALHWQWVVNAFKRYLLSPLWSRLAAARLNPASTVQK